MSNVGTVPYPEAETFFSCETLSDSCIESDSCIISEAFLRHVLVHVVFLEGKCLCASPLSAGESVSSTLMRVKEQRCFHVSSVLDWIVVSNFYHARYLSDMTCKILVWFHILASACTCPCQVLRSPML